MEDWIQCQLGDILNFRRGHDLPHSEMKGGDIPVAGSNGVIGYHNEATPISPCITIGRSGNIGTPYLYAKAWAHNTTLYVDDFKGNNPLYIYYLLRTLPLSSFSGGSAVPTLNRNHIHPLVVMHCTNLQGQKSIASLLKSFDDKIELNNRINHNLDLQIQAIYKSWFVDFEPFKDEEFINSELGLIPKGWDVKSLGDIATILKNTINPKKSEEAIFHHYSIPAFDNSESPEEQYGSEILSNKFIITDNTILFSKLNPRIKRVWNVFSAKENAVCSTEFVAYKAKEKKNYAFLYSVIAGDNFYNEIMSKVNGATGSHQRFHPEETLSIKIPYNAYAMMRFENAVLPIIRLMDINKQETASLKAERDSVLPRLLSGELEINKIDC